MTSHSKLSPSGASIWVNCPASVGYVESLKLPPDEGNKYSIEGTAAHYLAAYCKDMKASPFDFVGYKYDSNHLHTPWYAGGHEVSESMAGIIDDYLDFLYTLPRGITEARIAITKINPSCFGTADYMVYDGYNKTLYIVDLKYGKNRVLARDNLQLALYAIGAIDTLYPEARTAKLIIYQPRTTSKNPADVWTVTAEYLSGMAWGIKNSADSDYFNPGSHCRWCRALPYCNAAAKAVFDAVDAGIGENTMAQCLDRLPLVKAWAKSVESMAIMLLQNGVSIPGYKLYQKLGNRAWIDPEKAGEYLRRILGDRAYTKSLLSPTQADTITGKLGIFNRLTHRKPGTTKIEIDSNPFEEI